MNISPSYTAALTRQRTQNPNSSSHTRVSFKASFVTSIYIWLIGKRNDILITILTIT